MRATGFKQLVVDRIATIMTRLSRTSMPPERESEGVEGDPTIVIPWMVLESRRSLEGGRYLYRVSRWAVETLRIEELNRALSLNLEAAVLEKYRGIRDPGLLGLISAISRHASKGALDSLTLLVAVVAKEAGRPCTIDYNLRRERDAVEGKMKLYGMLLGIAIPLLILVSIIVDIYYLLPILLAAVALWLLIRRDGVKHARLNIEVARSECRITERDLKSIVQGGGDLVSEIFYTLLYRQR